MDDNKTEFSEKVIQLLKSNQARIIESLEATVQQFVNNFRLNMLQRIEIGYFDHFDVLTAQIEELQCCIVDLEECREKIKREQKIQ